MMLLSAPVEGNQARRFRVGRLDDPRALPARVQPIEKPRQQDGAGAVDPIEVRELDVNRAAPFEVRRRTLDGPRDRCRVREVERAARHETAAVSFAIHAYGDAHDATPPG